jgi:chromosomal replication initiation ATPase DnaA
MTPISSRRADVYRGFGVVLRPRVKAVQRYRRAADVGPKIPRAMRNRELARVVARKCSRVFDVPVEDILFGRDKSTWTARQVAYFVLKEDFRWSYSEIGAEFSRHHTSVLHGVRKIKQDNDMQLAIRVSYIRRQCKG